LDDEALSLPDSLEAETSCLLELELTPNLSATE
jgi:hypothetical protein